MRRSSSIFSRIRRTEEVTYGDWGLTRAWQAVSVGMSVSESD